MLYSSATHRQLHQSTYKSVIRIQKIRSFFVIGLCLLMLTAVPACSLWPLGSKLNKQKLPETIRAGIATDMPALAYQENKEIRGFDRQLALQLEAYAGIKVSLVPMPSSSLFPALQNGQIDIVLTGFSLETIKKQGATATVPYLSSGQVPLMSLTNQSRFSKKEGLLGQNVRIGTIIGSAGSQLVGNMSIQGTSQAFARPQDAIRALLRNKIDVFVYDLPANYYYAAANIDQGLIPGTTPYSTEKLAWALRQEDKNLLLLINDFLTQENDKGILTKMANRYIPFYGETTFRGGN